VTSFNIVASTDEYTVVSEYTPERDRSDEYQSEAALEKEFIERLCQQGYEYASIKSESSLIQNLRKQLERLNSYQFTEKEWAQLFDQNLSNKNDGIVEKTRRIQTDHVVVLKCDDGSSKNISLINKKDIHANHLQVINQYEAEGSRSNRYDVTILVNGFPMVHVELKRRGVAIREAFNQIKRYERDSFWSGSGLFDYIQLFVISNGVHTKYYSNTTREQHIQETDISRRTRKTSNSFEFTSWWADANNKAITDLTDFTKTFFAKHTILAILTRYCIFTAEDMLLVMRPYQIAAAERILQRIQISNNYKKMGTAAAGGYIWHTTGSGKTLTSFKTAQLARSLDFIDKILFVVDRKDLDYQTMKEYDKFEKGAANGNADTKILQRQLEDPTAKIIITTIQKLSVFIDRNKAHPVYGAHIVIIFDECHRSQFGDMHSSIVKKFKNYHIFGFTGTPIFAANATGGKNPTMRTTEQAFGEKLHSYTIVDAINDGNVLPFRIDYINTVKESENIRDTQVASIDRERALCAPERISKISEYLLAHFDQKTKRSEYYNVKDRRLSGFNSILATASVDAAKRYYLELKKQNEANGNGLKIATIFSFAANEDEPKDVFPDEDLDVSRLDVSSRDFLDSAIKDYNAMFKTNFDSSSDKFGNYYKDLSKRMKDRDIDLLIVVNMFLTGFDATTLNTLWVDKNLKQHGLLQAFSRTNRILNSVKTYGNIICFRDLNQATNDAIALFGNKEAGGIVLLKPYDDYYLEYEKKIDELEEKYSDQILGEMNERDFIKLFGSILRLKNILSSFDEFIGEEILSPRDFQEYQSIYLDIYHDYRKGRPDKENIIGELVFEVELVKQVEVNIDYILMQVERFQKTGCKDKEIKVDISRAISSSIKLRSKKELIEEFIATVNVDTDVEREWEKFIKLRAKRDLDAIVSEENLKSEQTEIFMMNAFRDGVLRTTGTDFDKILPPVSRFSKNEDRRKKRNSVIEKLLLFFERFSGLL